MCLQQILLNCHQVHSSKLCNYINKMSTDDTLVEITQGKLRGTVEHTRNGSKFLSFMGIPFAKPPLGNLRFKAPQSATPWEGVLEANNDDHHCLHYNTFQQKIVGSSDCLYLNVYTPKLPKPDASLKPVMVWIYGGGFTAGSKSRVLYDPEFIIDKDVVIVAINYRVGVLGFLSLNNSSLGVSGNAGMKDQVMALKWIQNNITAFGGDPNNVTLFGESAGGASVSYLLLSPMAKGLFHKAITQSGSATSSWAQGRLDVGQAMLNALNAIASNDAEILSILENVGDDELIKAQLKLSDIWKPNESRYFAPTVETSTSEERFLSDTPINILKSGNYNKVPIINGCTSNEGLIILMINPKGIDMRPRNDAEYTPYWLNVKKERTSEIGNKIKQFYYGEETPSDENIQGYYDYLSDAYFCLGAFDVAENFIKTSGKKVFLYNFASVTNLNQFSFLFKFSDTCKGVCHGEDIFYIFKTVMTPQIEADSKEYIAIQRMTTWWTNFAKYSDPNGIEENSLLGVKWPAATDNMEYLNIDIQPSLGDKFCKKSIEFWRGIQQL